MGGTAKYFWIRDGEVKRRSFSYLTLTPDPPSMTVDNPQDKGESDARSRELLGAVESLKNTEELVNIAHVKARSVVLHEIDLLQWLSC